MERLAMAQEKDYWKFDGDHTITLYWHDAEGEIIATKETALLLPAWDWELNKTTLVS